MKTRMPLAKADNLTSEHVGEETVVYDAETHKAHRLNRVAEAVWRLCDGNTTLGQITSRLRQDLDPAVNLAIVETAVRDLGQAELLQEPVGLPSRRHIAAGALLVPIVSSILIPTPAAAQSGKYGGDKPGKGYGRQKPHPRH